MPAIKKSLLHISVFAVLIMMMVWIGPKLLEYKSMFFVVPYILWQSIFLLFAALAFSFDHILGWFQKGRLRIDPGYLLITVVLLWMNLSLYIPMGMPIIVMSGIVGVHQVAILAFWYCLLKTFYKEAA